jgi:hypothetical protein
MSSGARREEVLPGTALGGIAMSILTFYSGNTGAKFSKNDLASVRNPDELVASHECPRLQNGAEWQRIVCKEIVHRGEPLIFQGIFL